MFVAGVSFQSILIVLKEYENEKAIGDIGGSFGWQFMGCQLSGL